MKKQYIAPAMEIENVEIESLLDITSSGETFSLNLNPGGSSNVMDSKGHSFDLWGEEEE